MSSRYSFYPRLLRWRWQSSYDYPGTNEVNMNDMIKIELIHITAKHYRGGVTKVPFVNFSVSKIFDLVKEPLVLLESHLYLTGATAAKLRRHLPNTNEILNNWHGFWQCWKFWKKRNGGNWLSNPHPWASIQLLEDGVILVWGFPLLIRDGCQTVLCL